MPWELAAVWVATMGAASRIDEPWAFGGAGDGEAFSVTLEA